MDVSVQAAAMIAEAIRRGRIVETTPEAGKVACRLSDGGRVLVSTFLAAHIRPGDEIDFPLAINSAGSGTELYIRKASSSGRSRDLYQASICYAAQPKADKRDKPYVRTEVSSGRLGICSIHLPCEALHDYFYVANRNQPWERQTSLYETLRGSIPLPLLPSCDWHSNSADWNSAPPALPSGSMTRWSGLSTSWRSLNCGLAMTRC